MTDCIDTARALIEPLTGYTPGPWEAAIYEDVGFINVPPGVGFEQGDFKPVDARLIAAAPELRDMVATLADALEAEQAKVAAAYEAATTWLIEAGIAGDHDSDPLATCIRALTPADAEAALDKMLAEARAENQRLREALAPFGGAAESAIGSVGKTTTLGVLGAIAVYFVTWRDFARARAALNPEGEE